jgi:hypothetical protein
VIGLTPDAEKSFEVAAKLFRGRMERFDETEAAREWLLTQA